MFDLKGKEFQSHFLSTCTFSCKCGSFHYYYCIISMCILDFVVFLMVCIVTNFKEGWSTLQTAVHEMGEDVHAEHHEAHLAGWKGWYSNIQRCKVCSFPLRDSKGLSVCCGLNISSKTHAETWLPL